MPFSDLVIWIWMAVFLVGAVFVFEKALSSVFGFLLLICASIYFAIFFWVGETLAFGIMFAVFALLSLRFLVGLIPNSKNGWW